MSNKSQIWLAAHPYGPLSAQKATSSVTLSAQSQAPAPGNMTSTELASRTRLG